MISWEKVMIGKNNKFYYSLVREVDGELVLDLPDELLKSVGWDAGTVVEWSIDNQENIILRKVPDYTEL